MAGTQRLLIAALPLLLLMFNHGVLQVSSDVSIPALNLIPQLGVCGLKLGTLVGCNQAIKSKPPVPPTNPTTASQSSSAVPLPKQSSATAPSNQSSAATAPASSPTGSPPGSLSAFITSEETTVGGNFSELQSQCCGVVADINLGCACKFISQPYIAALSLVDNFLHQVAELCNVGFTGC